MHSRVFLSIASHCEEISFLLADECGSVRVHVWHLNGRDRLAIDATVVM